MTAPTRTFHLALSFLCFAALANLGFAAVKTFPAPPDNEHAVVPQSQRYAVRIAQGGKASPSFVYQSDAGLAGPGSQWVEGRSVSWTDFELSGTATIEVSLPGAQISESEEITVYPLRHGIVPTVSNGKARFQIPGEGHYVLTVGENGFDHALCLFANPLSLTPPSLADSPKIYFPEPGDNRDLIKRIGQAEELHFAPGAYQLGGGKLVLPKNIKRVHIAGGAVVYGAFFVGHDNVTIDGHGLLSGRYLKHREAHLIETPSNVGHTIVDGLTVSDFPYFAVRLLGHDSVIKNVKTVGPWVYNADGFVAWKRSTIRDSFIMANDDSIKVYDSNVSVRDCVIWNLNNGACLQLGWSSLDAHDIVVDGIDIIRTEWRPESNAANNGVINLRLSRGGENIQSNLLFQNIRVDTPVLRIFDLRMDGMGPERPANKHRFHNATFRNIDAKMLTLEGNPNNHNYIIPYDQDYGFKNLVFENLTINGTPITAQNAATAGRFIIDEKSLPEVTFK
ncbi:hypothetical protein IEN85_14480 [Pelagicoccus sp. NFK12]|uniref:Glycosyl hydrolase family 28 n=1 Tax=Pelagicoccus enzymogenes TaxID=2773457 RepID=A0A927IIF3_9BACT|nr:hypothetical protein [Pelagicoccus enzymogenes]MBD5780703.1 hypothetical protein [Pelagicoccus enzymogenes]